MHCLCRSVNIVMLKALFYLLIFPGLLFQVVCALMFEWLDRKLLARFQRRIGPRWFQPLADLIKLFSKEVIFIKRSNQFLTAALPVFSLCSVLTAGLYIPVAGFSPYAFEGDLIVIIFLLGVPTIAYFIAGIVSQGVYSILGGGRSLLQYFSYEVPLLIALSGPTVMADSWSIDAIMESQATMGAFFLFQPLGFALAIVGLIGKLKRDPFDIPKAKSEIVGGAFTEYSGVILGLWRLVMNIQAVTGIFLIINLFFGWSKAMPVYWSVPLFLLECIGMTLILSTISALFARLRIDQLAGLGWKILVPLNLMQLLLIVLMRR